VNDVSRGDDPFSEYLSKNRDPHVAIVSHGQFWKLAR
jgi:hypothetical protein